MMRMWSVTLTEHVEKCAVILKNAWKLTGDRSLFRPLGLYVIKTPDTVYGVYHITHCAPWVAGRGVEWPVAEQPVLRDP